MQVVPKNPNLDMSSPVLPGTWIKDYPRAAKSKHMSTNEEGVPHHESPRSHTHTRGQWLPPRPLKGQPPTIQGHGWGASAWSYCSREGRRRSQQGHACIDQATVQPAERALSAQLNVGQRQPIRLKNEVPRHRSTSTQSMQNAHQGHLRSDVPRRLSGQPAVPVLSRQFFGTLQIELETGRQGSFRFLQRSTIGSDIKVCANRVPPITVKPGITLQIHVRLPSPISGSNAGRQSTTSASSWPEPRVGRKE